MCKFNAIDLFCGAGGLSLGFQQAGFNIIVGVDNEPAALETFEFNHKGAIGLNADLSKQETFDLILKTAGDRKIDVIIAGPPCQGFSLTGPRNFDDPRNKLYLAVIEMVKQYSPKGFVIENVPGMATMYKGQVKDEVLKRFTEMGYNVDCRILKACDYGVPQMRKRLVFMGVRKDIGEPHFPGPPCQAYSVAGRIRDEHGMREDYRNYLFESYLEVVQHYKPKVFVFENVPGILSAKPGDGSVKIIDLIQKAFADAGYVVLPNLSNAIIDMTEYGVPQNRKRIIILGVSKAYYGDKAETMVEEFYSSYLPEYNCPSRGGK